jgi:hypothetical protein
MNKIIIHNEESGGIVGGVARFPNGSQIIGHPKKSEMDLRDDFPYFPPC